MKLKLVEIYIKIPVAEVTIVFIILITLYIVDSTYKLDKINTALSYPKVVEKCERNYKGPVVDESP